MMKKNTKATVLFSLCFIIFSIQAMADHHNVREIGVYSDNYHSEQRFIRNSIGFNYNSYISYNIEFQNFKSQIFDNKNSHGYHLSLKMTETILKDTKIFALFGLASIKKILGFGKFALDHQVDPMLGISLFFESFPLYTEIPLPEYEQHIAKSTLGLTLLILKDYQWNTSFIREGDFVIIERHKVAGLLGDINFKYLLASPKWSLSVEKASKPNPYHFVPSRLLLGTLALPLTSSKHRLWNFEISPMASFGQYQRHFSHSNENLSSIQLKSVISTKPICTICFSFTGLYETLSLSDSGDASENSIKFIVSLSAKS